HLALQLVGSNRPLPVILKQLRVAQIVFDLLFDLRVRHHLLQRRLGIWVRFWPDAMTPVNLFDHPLITDALRKAQRLIASDCRSSQGRDALVSIYAEGAGILRRR